MIFNVGQRFRGSACAKFILLGEHFIVHGGVPALSFPIHQLQTNIELGLQAPGDGVSCEALFEDRDGQVVPLPLVASAMGKTIDVAADIMGFNLKHYGLCVRSHSNFPVSRGFGSSAAFALALGRAFAQYIPVHEGRIPQLVSALEDFFHGNPSGVDAATILAGQAIRFENKKVVATIENRAADFILLNSGERVGCKELVAEVARQRESNPGLWREDASVLAKLVDKCQHALAIGDTAAVGNAVQNCHSILSGLGLSTDPIERAIEEGLRLGAVGGKVSGAGAGGAVVLVTKPGVGVSIAAKMLDQGYDVLAVEKAQDAKSSLGN